MLLTIGAPHTRVHGEALMAMLSAEQVLNWTASERTDGEQLIEGEVSVARALATLPR